MGGGFCPFCASERWAIVSAVTIFGSWEGLVETASADLEEKYTSTFRLSILLPQNTQASM